MNSWLDNVLGWFDWFRKLDLVHWMLCAVIALCGFILWRQMIDDQREIDMRDSLKRLTIEKEND